jgi:hypothetical protein
VIKTNIKTEKESARKSSKKKWIRIKRISRTTKILKNEKIAKTYSKVQLST